MGFIDSFVLAYLTFASFFISILFKVPFTNIENYRDWLLPIILVIILVGPAFIILLYSYAYYKDYKKKVSKTN
jgi:hypothetical protein